MKFKRILSLLLVLCMVLSITACGIKASSDDDDDDGKRSSQSSKDKDKDEDDDEDDEKSSSKDKDDEDDEDEDDKDKADDDEDDKDEDDKEPAEAADEDNPYKDMREVELPKGFPEDAYPIYKGGKIYNASLDKRNDINVFSAWVVFDTKVDTVSEFYKNLLKDAEGFEDQSSMGFVMYSGKMEGYKFSLNLIPDATNDKYSILTMELTEIPTAGKVLETLAEGELPENYPADLFPIIDGGAIYDATESESNDEVSYSITVYTDKSLKDIVAFYEEKIGTIEDKSKSVSSDDFDFYGTAHKYHFSIYGGRTEEKGVELSRYYLSLDPVAE